MTTNKKYKLIKTYPGYEILGAIAYKSGEYYYVVNPDKSISENYIKQLPRVIENNPEYWEWIITKNKLLNKYLEVTKKPFADIGSMYNSDVAEKCIKIADDYAIEFLIWASQFALLRFDDDNWQVTGLAEFGFTKTVTTKEILEQFKKEKGL
jgi:hypothetical protein